MVRVSICIPAYKQPEYLRRALESVLIQSYEDYEVIITDDSPDDSVARVICEFQHDKKIKYHKNYARKGSPANWNEALDLASGDYIKILHHDDWFTGKDSLLQFVSLLDDNETADFAFSSTYVCDDNQKIKYLHEPTEHQLKMLYKNPFIIYLGNFVGSPSATIFRNKSNIRFDRKLKWVVDIDYYIRLLTLNSNFLYCAKPLIFTTSGASHQVTAECEGNREVELFEWIYLFNKIQKIHRLKFDMFKHVWDIIKKYKVKSSTDLIDVGIEPPIPMKIKTMVYLQKLLYR